MTTALIKVMACFEQMPSKVENLKILKINSSIDRLMKTENCQNKHALINNIIGKGPF
jgi:hypothetical protein